MSEEKKQPKEFLKCYADAPDGTANKYLCYKVYDYDQTMHMLGKFKKNGWRIRAAWHQFDNGKSVKIPNDMIKESETSLFHTQRKIEAHLKKFDEDIKNFSKKK